MNKSDKYLAASKANFTAAEFAKARENEAWVAKRHPQEFAAMADVVTRNGLEGHREIVGHFLKYRSPMNERELGTLVAFADSTYAGPFGRGKQVEAPAQTATADGLDRLYPSGAKTGA